MKVAVIGSGYVGLVTAVCLAEIGHQVISVDANEAKIEALNRGEMPIYEQLLPELLRRHLGRRLHFSASLSEAVGKAQTIFITVGTPKSESGEADMSYVDAVASNIAAAVEVRKLIVEKSTVPVRTCELIRRTLLLNGAAEGCFAVASNPEFLREGTAVKDFLHPDRIVIGADEEFGAAMLQEIYRPLITGEYHRRPGAIPSPTGAGAPAKLVQTTVKSAELIKHACNAFLATRISFINMIAVLAEQVGADIDEVCAGMGSDPRIGSQFLRPGIGYGGSCFPKDVAAFHSVAAMAGVDFSLLREVTRINDEQRLRYLAKVREALWTVRGKRLGVLGLAFKGGTDDVRDSPALAVVGQLCREGARIRAYDPAAMYRAREVIAPPTITYAEDEYAAATNADALLILTDWKQFVELDLHRLHSVMRCPIVIDGRNIFSPQAVAAPGFEYHSVGRVAVGCFRPTQDRDVTLPAMVARPHPVPPMENRRRFGVSAHMGSPDTLPR